MRWQRRTTFYWILLVIFTSILIWFQVRQKRKTDELYHILRTIKKSEQPVSLCSSDASLEGFNQKVISFSLYITKGQESFISKRGYMTGINLNAQKIREIYPGWLMRIYTNQMDLFLTNSDFKELIQADHVFICDVTSIPILGDMSQILQDGMLWRLLPLFDPTVDIFVSRDLDSIVNSRERAAVHEWEKSDLTFHTMRDHYYHLEFVMGGLWGAKTYKLDEKTKTKIAERLSDVIFGLRSRNDQDILRLGLYSQFSSDFMTHDSYHCEIFPNAWPFPTQRENEWDFVGAYLTNRTGVGLKCPTACRPPYGKDWEYC